VRLVRGEAHFTVAKNPARPFIVEAGGVAVRAVGTAFDVRHADGAIEVLVTEGKVHVRAARAARRIQVPAPAPIATPLVAGERAVVDTTRPATAPAVAVVERQRHRSRAGVAGCAARIRVAAARGGRD